ncbi:cell shape-determining protein MreB [Chitinophaga agrisoli]|uniref:Cell shape-determining protein MreB n=1 Tax=Chitinophaga agrisoli TaxID=2607653 RepID=A0A5B2W2J4_9BACT|nr:cell shape-determining protein MreB [Chitinophaga agrisoli]KAA2244469.1 cell shape-determining protein MreB [Chitinophaga agrisoli]
MKLRASFIALSGIALGFASCSNDDKTGPTPPNNDKQVVLVGKIDRDRTLSKDTVYVMRDYVYVVNNATLTIQPGTTILGGQVSPTKGGTLIITRGAKLIAAGTADAPIVFTSEKPVGQRKPGDWGGIILLGKATTNRPANKRVPEGIEGADASVDMGYGGPGGSDAFVDTDNSGKLQYVRVEFGGIALASTADSEVNGITFYSVGNGTTVDHIQVSYSGDDACEFFGGTVNVKYAVAYGTKDDNFDMDSGFKGKLQFCVVLQDPAFSDVVSLSNGLEVDNLNGANTSTPYTHPVISNLTIVGPGTATGNGDYFYAGARWRRGSTFTVANSIFSGDPVATDVEGWVSQNALQHLAPAPAADYSNITNSVFQAAGISPISTQRGAGSTAIGPLLFDADKKDSSIITGAQVKALILTTANKNDSLKALTDVFTAVPAVANFKATNTEFKLSSAVAAKTAAFTDALLADAFFDKVSYVGAVDPNAASPWTKASWINWAPQDTQYGN